MASDHQRLVAEALLKAEKKYDELKKTDNKIIYDLSNKLEAVKKWYDEHHTYRAVYDVNWDHLKKILEAEG